MEVNKGREELWKSLVSRSFSPREWFDGEFPGFTRGEQQQKDTMMWIYRQEGNGKFLVGFYDPSRVWHLDSECPNRAEAAKRVHWLNGGLDTADN